MEKSNHLKTLDRLEEVAQQFVRLMQAKMEKILVHGITGTQFFVMKKIHEHGRLTVSAAADYLGVTLSAITSLTDRLVKMGFVGRSRDESDRRIVWLEITHEGEEVLRSCFEGRKRIMEKYLGQLPQEDLNQLLIIFEKLLVIISKEKD